MQNKPKVLTVPALKRFNARADVRAAIAAIKVTRERSERITAHVENYLAPAFAAFEPFYASGTRITDRADLYMCDDAQDAQCAAWYAHCDVLHASNGYNVREGYCPALVAQDDARKSENALLAMVTDLTGADFNGSLELRAKALELFMNPPML